MSLDDVPVIVVIVRREDFRGAGDEIGDDGVHGYTRTGQHDPGLSGRSERCLVSSAPHRLVQRQGGVFLADGAIRANREHALAAAFLAGSDRNPSWWNPNIDEPSPGFLGGFPDLGKIFEFQVQSAGDIEPRRGRFDNHVPPGLRDHTADRCDTDHQRANTGLHGLSDRHVGNAQIGGAALETQLAGYALPAPVNDAEAGLRIGRIFVVADQYQVGRA